MRKFCLALVGLLVCGLAVAAPPQVVSVRPALSREMWARRFRNSDWSVPAAEAKLYEKFELQVDLRTTFTNPFDPDQVDLSAEFTAPSGKVYNIWGFYNPSWGAEWMLRFSPTEVGTWKYVVKVRDQEGQAESQPGEFRCVPSDHPGFVTIASNRRYLTFSNGTSFYGVGMWYNDGFGSYGQGTISEKNLDELRDAGANFISFFSSPLETRGTGLGRYDPARVGRLDEVFQWCEDRDMYISWNLVFHAFISEAVWGAGNTQYLTSPYRSITSAKDFFGSDEAWKYQEKLYRYVIARWGYSRALYLWLVVDEINGTEGWTEGDHAVAEAWCRKMRDFFHAHDPYGRPTAGTQSGGIDQWWADGYKIFDIAAREIYEAQGHPMPPGGKPDLVNHNPLRYSYLNYAKQTQALWRDFDKPAIIAETGWDLTYYEPGMPGYLATYHNALWATLVNGTCASPFWWAYSGYINPSVVTPQMGNLARFVRDIDFAGADWRPIQVEMSSGDGWAMQSDALTFGWVANPTSGVAQESFTVGGLEDGSYEVHLYRTWRGQYIDPIEVTAAHGKVTVSIPELTVQEDHGQNIGDDIAFKITKPGTYHTSRRNR
jgi:Domain of unknown function (DUF5060)